MDSSGSGGAAGASPAWIGQARKVLTPILIACVLIETLTGWGLRLACRGCIIIPGGYWLVIGASMALLPLIGLCLVGMVGCLIAAPVMGLAHKPGGPDLLSSAGLLFVFVVLLIAAGFIHILAPMTHDAGLSVNGKTYLLSTADYLVDEQAYLYECDGFGLMCSQIFSRGDLYSQCNVRTLTADPATGQVSVRLSDTNGLCTPKTIYPVDQ